MKRDIDNIEDDISATKRVIENVLCGDTDIVEIINNPDVDPSVPEDLIMENIFPFIRVPGTVDVSKNYITFMIDDIAPVARNDVMKQQIIQFVIFVHKDLVCTPYGVARHDLLGFIIRDIFNRSSLFGKQLKLISDREGVTDTDYYTRTLKFQLITTEVSQNGKFINAYERDSVLNHDRRINHEPI